MNKLIHNEGSESSLLVSYDELSKHLLVPGIKESELIKNILLISENFTTSRSEIKKYVLDEALVSSYASFYLPTNVPKLKFLFDKLSDEIKADMFEREFIDIGSGPGTFSLAFRALREKDGSKIYSIDTSSLMLSQAKKMMSAFFPKQEAIFQNSYLSKNQEAVLFFGHSINEMGIDRAQDLIMTIDPEYILWIEPGTSDVFPLLIKLREAILEHYDVLYPCPKNAACPSDWCHQVLRTSHDPSIERLSQLVGLDRKVLPMTAHVYRRKGKKKESTTAATVIRYIQETKFSFEYEVCDSVNDKNENYIVEIQKKDLSKDEVKHFKNANVGDRLVFQVEKIIGQKKRVKLRKIEF